MEKYYDPNIKDWPSKKKYFLNNCKLKEGEKRYFSYYLDKIYDGKQIAWDTQWLYYNIFEQPQNNCANCKLNQKYWFL